MIGIRWPFAMHLIATTRYNGGFPGGGIGQRIIRHNGHGIGNDHAIGHAREHHAMIVAGAIVKVLTRSKSVL